MKQTDIRSFFKSTKELVPKSEPEPSPEKIDIDGLTIVENFISEDEEKKILNIINSYKWDTTLKRRTQQYGYTYDYTSYNCTKTQPIPESFNFIIDKIVSDFGINIEQIIINEYLPGQGISRHTDSKIFGNEVFSLSLNSDTVMEFSSDSTTIERPLKRRSVLMMKDGARYIWKHSIPSRHFDNGIKRNTRISMTFRKLK
jgi:alkylated DNA repair dioxygenase AlkB